MTQAAQKEQSKVAFQAAKAKGTGPASTFTAGGKTVPIKPSSQAVTNVRNITHERYVTRETRVGSFYAPYYGRAYAPVYYHDPFGPFFYLWLFDRASADQRAAWAYNHRDQIDDARWQDMVRKDATLEARVRQLEAEKRVRDPNYVPAELKDQPDLMYSDEFVQAAYNAPATPAPSSSGAAAALWGLGILVVVALLFWLCFIKDWKTHAHAV